MIEITLVENESKPFEQAINAEMDKAIKHYEGELIKIRTGRAHTSMIEAIQVSCYVQIQMDFQLMLYRLHKEYLYIRNVKSFL